jgi:hypothetical protein
MALRTDNLPNESPEIEFGAVDKVMFQGVKEYANSFSAFCASKKLLV